MFISYDPAGYKGKPSRRTINAFVAVHAAKRRRKLTEQDQGISTYWLESEDSDPKHGKDCQVVQRIQPVPLRMTLPIAPGKFYPISLDTKGPSTNRALAYYFDVLLPHDSSALGHGDSRAQFYASVLLHWSNAHDAILHGLAAFTLCTLEPQERVDPARARAATLYHRKKLFDLVTDMLGRQVVDDLLIQALCLLIPIDDYLGYVDFSQAHLDGLETVVRARGGLAQVGQSVPGMGPNLQTSLLVSKSLVSTHIQTSLAYTTAPATETARLFPSLSAQSTLDLPIGFQRLIHTGHLSTNSVPILQSFSAWLGTHGDTPPTQIPVWRYSAPAQLTAIEKCIFAALLCFADDLSCMGFHPAAIVFRQPQKRAEILLAVPALWSDPALADFALWMALVITTPRNLGIAPIGVQRTLFCRVFDTRSESCVWEDVDTALHCFFYDPDRAKIWEGTWKALYKGWSPQCG
ncbi:hypothetical protein BDW74DRAFT_180411 [Aspergillus multicolor]|uniref:uncharacterized protein n=1 Tax=Aspergillus multicolor TaxID=41759 RepID=UPI003CCDD10B